MSKSCLKFAEVTFIYDSAGEPLFEDLSLHIDTGWTGVIGPNGAGKTTLLKLASGLLAPTTGRVTCRGDTVYCAQRTDRVPDEFGHLLADNARDAQIIKSHLDISYDWIDRWDTLSHGQRKRVQIATALWSKPAVLAVDEPTNHLDGEGREFVAKALTLFDGIGLLVSHDRELLDSLCRQCLFIRPPEVILRPGGYTHALATIESERQSMENRRGVEKRALKRLQREATKRSQLAAGAQKRRSKRNLGLRDSDGREKKDRVRVSGKDATGGRLRRQLQGRLDQARSQLGELKVQKQYELGIWLPACRSKRNVLLEIEPGSLPLGPERKLGYPHLTVTPTDRIAITGPNGSGKSTLIRHILPLANVPEDRVTYIPQEIDMARCRRILEQARRLAGERLGHLMNIVSRLGSRPERLLYSEMPSPGETRKLLLALGMTRAPHLIVMDEPTNHMDLPSIECLEQALADCPSALILVSHDERFLGRLTRTCWNLTEDPDSQADFVVNLR
jgi:ATPase subunit of ABC transporter with duplicated ATPase domains